MDRKLYYKRYHRSKLMVALALLCFAGYGQDKTDTIKAWNLYQQPQQVYKDSIDARLKFVQDSIKVREQFVRDSIQRRKQILDSLIFLQTELQPLLEAIHWTYNEDIISHADKISLIGDSVLSDYGYHKLPLILSEPFTPWKGRLSLNAKQIRFYADKNAKKISAIKSPSLTCSLSYVNQGMIVIIHEDYILQKNSSGNFFRYPLDSIFYDRNKRIMKIKRYVQFYDLLPGNKKGALLFTNLSQVKQYQYEANNRMSKYELVKFCDRYKAYDKNEVCSIVNYTIAKQDNSYLVTRRNNPENEFSDGTFTLEFDEHENVKCIAFRVQPNTLKWQRFVELNKEGNVNCYIDKMLGVTSSTRCMIYHNEPNAKYPVEIIKTSFEKDGVDYTQSNLTTDKTRVRDRMTLVWGPWK